MNEVAGRFKNVGSGLKQAYQQADSNKNPDWLKEVEVNRKAMDENAPNPGSFKYYQGDYESFKDKSDKRREAEKAFEPYHQAAQEYKDMESLDLSDNMQQLNKNRHAAWGNLFRPANNPNQIDTTPAVMPRPAYLPGQPTTPTMPTQGATNMMQPVM